MYDKLTENDIKKMAGLKSRKILYMEIIGPVAKLVNAPDS